MTDFSPNKFNTNLSSTNLVKFYFSCVARDPQYKWPDYGGPYHTETSPFLYDKDSIFRDFPPCFFANVSSKLLSLRIQHKDALKRTLLISSSMDCSVVRIKRLYLFRKTRYTVVFRWTKGKMDKPRPIHLVVFLVCWSQIEYFKSIWFLKETFWNSFGSHNVLWDVVFWSFFKTTRCYVLFILIIASESIWNVVKIYICTGICFSRPSALGPICRPSALSPSAPGPIKFVSAGFDFLPICVIKCSCATLRVLYSQILVRNKGFS